MYKKVDVWRAVGKLGSLHLVVSRRNREIEVFFKDTKQLLGLGHYQNRPYTAAVTHLHLVCFAYALLTHSAIERICIQEKRSKQANVSVREPQDDLRCMVWDDTAKYPQELPDEKYVFKELSRLLVAA